MPPRTLPLTLLRPFLDPRSKERFVDLRKARDLDDLGKQKQALLGFPNESIVPPRNDALPSDTMGTGVGCGVGNGLGCGVVGDVGRGVASDVG